MSSSNLPSDAPDSFDAKDAWSLDAFPNHKGPKNLCYHRFTDDDNVDHEIWVPPGREQEVKDLDAKGDWSGLLKFSPFSDRPFVASIWAYVFTTTRDDGTEVSRFIPQDGDKRARFNELSIAGDWDAIEREFEPWSK